MTYWGRSTTNGSAYPATWQRAMGGDFIASDATLNGVEIYCEGDDVNLLRVAVYVGGTLEDPSGATLLEDLGTIAPPAVVAWTFIASSANPTISADSIVWIHVHGDQTAISVFASTSSADSGDFQSARGRADLGAALASSTAPPSSLGSGTFSGFWYAWRLDYAEALPATPEIRKSSTFDIETTLGTITTATLNSVDVFDHVTGQVGTTVSFAGAATDEITTSGEYTLTLGDGATTEDITVQVNVYGVAPSNNPLQKEGTALASLTGVQARVTDGANINGTELYYSGTATTDASGNLGNIDLSSTAAADTDPVLLHLRTAAGDSIIVSETVELL